ncbi:MAG: thioredoxin domain-containing protein [Bdellovibrionales bacterium]|nr:thioredoxin domain-containing protein [Bdellovibrionales bacterium]
MAETQKTKNRLAAEKSPYLLQHQNNPVDWFPWGEEAFKAAKEQNKPVFLSIGYSTCYWCHVMEQDSFEREDVAAVLNKHFISIKVDREERPDIDQIYMDAVMALTGHGGWPMSVFLTPDKKPFYGGTFFWRAQFIQILEQIAAHWSGGTNNIDLAAEKLTEALQTKTPEGIGSIREELLSKAFKQFRSSYDASYGGFGPAPKFPRPESVELLLRIYRRSGNDAARTMAVETLRAMAYGGIYDHVGGGFSRYSTDAKWLVPHFEKMLYDNALLVSAYLDAYTAVGEETFAHVARETLDYVLEQMTDTQGGFYSAEDAGEVGQEGAFYVWSYAELEAALSKSELSALQHLFITPKEGNFEHGKIVLSRKHSFSWAEKSEPEAAAALTKLKAIRSKRPRPHLDDKILTSWNALMIRAMAKGYKVLGEDKYLKAAQAAASFLRDNLQNNNKLLRRFRGGSAKYDAYLEDYAYLISALLELYEADFNPAWLNWAKKLQVRQDELFWDVKDGGYYYTDTDNTDVLIRKKDFNDGAIPSGNSIAAMNLLRMHDIFFDKLYRDRAEKTLETLSPFVERVPYAYAAALQAFDYYFDNSKEIVVVADDTGEEAKAFLKQLRGTYLPNAVVALNEDSASADFPALLSGKTLLGGKTTFFICENHTCKAPTNSSAEALKLVAEFRHLEL